MQSKSPAIAALLEQLGIDRLVLSIHQASFPAGEGDLGIGTPYAPNADRFLTFAAALGFNGVALGPGGITSRGNPSPYDSSLFSLNPAFVSARELVQQGLVTADRAATWQGHGNARRVDHRRAFDASRDLLRCARIAATAGDIRPLRAQSGWPARLLAEALFEGAAASALTDDWRSWPTNPPVDAAAVDDFLFGQQILRNQHERFRDQCRSLGLRLYADAQVGVSHRDLYLNRSLFLADYVMGAPPSRTNPSGQAWCYPVLDPEQLAVPDGAARQFLRDRFEWLAATHDGIRLDHPHGWVCPWVYRRNVPNPLAAVQAGARLFESPDVPDHPALARFARVRADQVDHRKRRYDDDWVQTLTPAQVTEYATQIEMLEQTGIALPDLMVEVLSTCPKPLDAVLDRFGLGRFRVLQKARVDLREDVYRSDRAEPRDWVMVGNHDTPSLRSVVDSWQETDEMAMRAAYLATRLEPDDARRSELARTLRSDAAAMCQAMLADCFVGPAKHVLLFWTDLFGECARYNAPGVVSEDNWTLRVPPDFEARYAQDLESGAALSLERALRMALHARR